MIWPLYITCCWHEWMEIPFTFRTEARLFLVSEEIVSETRFCSVLFVERWPNICVLWQKVEVPAKVRAARICSTDSFPHFNFERYFVRPRVRYPQLGKTFSRQNPFDRKSISKFANTFRTTKLGKNSSTLNINPYKYHYRITRAL